MLGNSGTIHLLRLVAVDTTNRNQYQSSGNSQYEVILAGLSNVYSSYIATTEEYQLQRYEGASTIYGQYTLPAYVQQFAKLTWSLVQKRKLDPGPAAPYFVGKLLSLVPKVIYDTAPLGKRFGSVLKQPQAVYYNKNDTVEVRFVTASPRNNIRSNGTYLTVEKLNEKLRKWEILYTDANWETKFVWKRSGFFTWLLGQSDAIITWTVSSIDGSCTPANFNLLSLISLHRVIISKLKVVSVRQKFSDYFLQSTTD
ncbi:unnamed protein product [Heterobilharzia americana]|nr:unnamed protein product [Heterobilharzia americana]